MAWGLLQLVGGESSPTVLLIGLRFWLLYIWFGVAAAAAMNEADYRAAVLVAATVLLLMAPLSVLQHFSPTGARVNAQLEGGDEEGIFVAVAGVVRTTGTLSFTLGYSTFIALTAPLVFALVGARKRTKLQFLFVTAVLGCFVIASVVSGSRAAVIYSGVMLAAYFAGRLWLAKGKGKVESFTVIYGRSGDVEHGVVMLRTEDDKRTLARIPAQDNATLAHMRNMDRTPVGSVGDIAMADDGVPEWRVG